MAKLAIKTDNRKQSLLLPLSLDEHIPENHLVRVVDAVIDRLDISAILSTYRGGGNSAFNSKMMLKVLVFAYLSNVYSSRRIEELLKWDTCDYNRRLSEIGIAPQFIQKINLMLFSTQRPPCNRRDVINNILERFFDENEILVKENSIIS